ncbi:hypothetical protein D918_09004 [Trichuris suis]|nr:hypothetical protein D918_09004 [Trichuris suis]
MPRKAIADGRQAKLKDRFQRWLPLPDKQRFRIENLVDSFCEERFADLGVSLPAGQGDRKVLRKRLSQKEVSCLIQSCCAARAS